MLIFDGQEIGGERSRVVLILSSAMLGGIIARLYANSVLVSQTVSIAFLLVVDEVPRVCARDRRGNGAGRRDLYWRSSDLIMILFTRTRPNSLPSLASASQLSLLPHPCLSLFYSRPRSRRRTTWPSSSTPTTRRISSRCVFAGASEVERRTCDSRIREPCRSRNSEWEM